MPMTIKPFEFSCRSEFPTSIFFVEIVGVRLLRHPSSSAAATGFFSSEDLIVLDEIAYAMINGFFERSHANVLTVVDQDYHWFIVLHHIT